MQAIRKCAGWISMLGLFGPSGRGVAVGDMTAGTATVGILVIVAAGVIGAAVAVIPVGSGVTDDCIDTVAADSLSVATGEIDFGVGVALGVGVAVGAETVVPVVSFPCVGVGVGAGVGVGIGVGDGAFVGTGVGVGVGVGSVPEGPSPAKFPND